jgi:putative hydrolase of the HAD superfamily
MIATSLVAEQLAEKTSYEAIIFDFGNVLYSNDKEALRSFIQTTFSLTPENTYVLYKEVRRKAHKYRYQPKCEEKAWESCAKKYKLTLPQNWIEQLEQEKNKCIHAVDSMPKIVEHLQKQGYRVGLLSNVSHRKAARLKKLDLYKSFDPLLLSCDMGMTKPHSEAYSYLLKELKCPPQVCLFIDDREENIIAAKKAGIDAIHFLSFNQLLFELKRRSIILPFQVD